MASAGALHVGSECLVSVCKTVLQHPNRWEDGCAGLPRDTAKNTICVIENGCICGLHRHAYQGIRGGRGHLPLPDTITGRPSPGCSSALNHLDRGHPKTWGVIVGVGEMGALKRLSPVRSNRWAPPKACSIAVPSKCFQVSQALIVTSVCAIVFPPLSTRLKVNRLPRFSGCWKPAFFSCALL